MAVSVTPLGLSAWVAVRLKSRSGLDRTVHSVSTLHNAMLEFVHGSYCFLEHCPSGDNPRTPAVDETNCHGIYAKDSIYAGAVGNLCQVDCANLGLCDYKTGKCQCFDGYYGLNCTLIDNHVVYEHWKTKSYDL